MKKEIESKSFTVVLNGESRIRYDSTEDTQYLWAVGMAGEIQVMRKILHTQFSAVIREDRIRVFADGRWVEVEVHDDEEDDDTNPVLVA